MGVLPHDGQVAIDRKPHLGISTSSALIAAELLLIPVRTGHLSIEVMPLLLEEIEATRARSNRHLRALAASIERHGLIQPITVERHDDEQGGSVLVTGERRFRAHGIFGRNAIHAIVTQGAADEIALIENIPRQDLHPLEEAAAQARMMQTHGWTRPSITDLLKLNGLAEPIKAICAQRGDVSKSLLFEIARLDETQPQEQLWARVRAAGAVRHARAATADRVPGEPAGPDGAATLPGIATSARRLLKHLVAAAAEVRPGDDGVRKEIAVLRRDLEALLHKLGRTGPAKRAS